MNTENEPSKDAAKETLEKCGVVMPISEIENCSESHWSDVREILYDAVETAGFEPNLVSNADDVGVIQKRIIQNLYQNPIVVCDISCKNPNVMLELGIRLAFDKPTIVVKDDETSFSFDTSPIEHILYPRDLRFSKIVEFKNELTKKIKGTHKAATSDPENYTTFLKHFGTFTVAKLDSKEISGDEMIIEEIRELRTLLNQKHSSTQKRHPFRKTNFDGLSFARELSALIKEHCKSNKLTRKTAIRKTRDKIRDAVEMDIAPEYFITQTEYQKEFDRVFDLLYG